MEPIITGVYTMSTRRPKIRTTVVESPPVPTRVSEDITAVRQSIRRAERARFNRRDTFLTRGLQPKEPEGTIQSALGI